jgi:hypothetical protein
MEMTKVDIYIYMCVCVCVYLRVSVWLHFGSTGLPKWTHVIAIYCRRTLLANFLEFSLHKTKQDEVAKTQ